MSQINRFNIRVYFILYNEAMDSILVSDEIIKKNHYTKFPGGGLEYGEGIEDCVRREAIEELGQAIEVTGHFYTTDFFVRSAFRESDQVVSVYYTARLTEAQQVITHEVKFQFNQEENDEESFRWVKLEMLASEHFEFPADKEVVRRLISLDK
jgi:8-oxo-dGTP diphosphatase